MKAPDNTAIPMCAKHHRQWHDGTGVFGSLPKLERFIWAQRAIARTQDAHSKGVLHVVKAALKKGAADASR